MPAATLHVIGVISCISSFCGKESMTLNLSRLRGHSRSYILTGIERPVTARKGDNKNKSNIDDIVNILETVDDKKAVLSQR